MTASRSILAVAGSVLIVALAQASARSSPLQQSSGNSADTANGRAGSSAPASAGQSKGQESNASAQHRKSGGIPRKSVRRQTILPVASRPKPARKIQGVSRSQDALHVEQPTLSKTRAIGGRIANTHAPAVRPIRGSAIGGQGFPHRSSAPIPTALGGSAAAKRNTYAINGSEIRFRH